MTSAPGRNFTTTVTRLLITAWRRADQPEPFESGHRLQVPGGREEFRILTDNGIDLPARGGLDYKDYLEFSRGADLLIHDAEYNETEYKKTKG